MTEKILRIYFDNCCYNRPYDDQSQIRISLEAQAKIFIQNVVRYGKLELATSFVLRHENNKNPYANKRISISDFIEKYTTVFVDSDRIFKSFGGDEKCTARLTLKLDIWEWTAL